MKDAVGRSFVQELNIIMIMPAAKMFNLCFTMAWGFWFQDFDPGTVFNKFNKRMGFLDNFGNRMF